CAYSSSPSYENGPVARWGERLFLAFESRVNILDTRTGRRIGAIETNSLITSIAAFKDVKQNEDGAVTDTMKTILVTCSVNGNCTIFDASSFERRNTWKPHTLPVTSLAFHQSGVFLATASADCRVRVWDITRFQCTHSFSFHTDVVTRVEFFPDPSKYILCACSEDRTISILDMISNTCLYKLEGHTSPPVSFTFCCSTSDQVNNKKDKSKGQIQSKKEQQSSSNSKIQQQFPSGCKLVSASRDGTVFIWNMETGQSILTYPLMKKIEDMTDLCGAHLQIIKDNNTSLIQQLHINNNSAQIFLRTHYRCAYSSSPSYENGPVARWGERLFLAFESRVNILDTRTGRRIGA
ncbi:MAG: hypothetical protein EZS28_045895, partial [Streblomastix strix]